VLDLPHIAGPGIPEKSFQEVNKDLRLCVGGDQCEVIGGRRYKKSYACDPDGHSMRVCKCDGHGKVDRRPCEVNVQ